MANINTDLIEERVLDTLRECVEHGLMTQKELNDFKDDLEYRLDLSQIEQFKTTKDQNAWHMGYSEGDEDDDLFVEELTKFEEMGGEFHV